MLHIKNLHLSFYNEPTVGANAQGALQQLLAGLGTSTQTNAAAPSEPAPVVATTTLTPPAPGQPWPGQGGIYICTLPAQFGLPARHLVVGTNEAEDLTWGPYGEEAAGATSQTDGRANTAALRDITAWLPTHLGVRLNPSKTILQPVDRGLDFVGQVIKPWRRTTRRRTLASALQRIEHMPAAEVFSAGNSYLGLVRQASHSRKERAAVCRALLKRGHAVEGMNLSKAFRRNEA